MNNTDMQPMEILYKKVGDYYFSMLTYPAANRPIGHWGRMRHDYLKEHRPVYFFHLVLSGRFSSSWQHWISRHRSATS